jgi:hypothetical protein
VGLAPEEKLLEWEAVASQLAQASSPRCEASQDVRVASRLERLVVIGGVDLDRW